MNLSDQKINTKCKIIQINLPDKKMKLRLQELGLYTGSIIFIKKFSTLKHTILIQIFNSIFALKTKIAESISIEILKED